MRTDPDDLYPTFCPSSSQRPRYSPKEALTTPANTATTNQGLRLWQPYITAKQVLCRWHRRITRRVWEFRCEGRNADSTGVRKIDGRSGQRRTVAERVRSATDARRNRRTPPDAGPRSRVRWRRAAEWQAGPARCWPCPSRRRHDRLRKRPRRKAGSAPPRYAGRAGPGGTSGAPAPPPGCGSRRRTDAAPGTAPWIRMPSGMRRRGRRRPGRRSVRPHADPVTAAAPDRARTGLPRRRRVRHGRRPCRDRHRR